jgi:hypothetical protein
MSVRMLTLEDVPDHLLVECGLTRGEATGKSYHCTDKEVALIPTVEVHGSPRRMLNRVSLAKILKGFRDGDSIPAVDVFHESEMEPRGCRLLNGMHRWRAAQAIGYVAMPCRLVERKRAEVACCYPPLPSK